MPRTADPKLGLKASATPASTKQTDEVVPRNPSDIPGLGPIRVRALQKAGLSSLAELRNASLEALMAVPGLTEIKARHIQTYLSRFTEEQIRKACAPPAVARETSTGTVLVQWPAPSVQVDLPTPLATETVRTLAHIVALLLGAQEASFRNRLNKAIERIAQRSEALITTDPALSAKDRERAMRRLRRISEAIDEFTAHDILDRKSQLKLAETLDETSDWLTPLIDAGSHRSSGTTKETND